MAGTKASVCPMVEANKPLGRGRNIRLSRWRDHCSCFSSCKRKSFENRFLKSKPSGSIICIGSLHSLPSASLLHSLPSGFLLSLWPRLLLPKSPLAWALSHPGGKPLCSSCRPVVLEARDSSFLPDTCWRARAAGSLFCLTGPAL